MMIMTANASGRAFHWLECQHRQPHALGWLVGPSALPKTSLSHGIPFALDNDAFAAFTHGTEWNEAAWLQMLRAVYVSGRRPLWSLVPDKVADRAATIELWHQYLPEVLALGWLPAFAVQDGMTPDDVPDEADVIFVGGSTEWKWRTVEMWCKSFPRVHVGRVNTIDRLHLCASLGAESVDGTGWMRHGSEPGSKWDLLQDFLAGTSSQPWFLPNTQRIAHPPVCRECDSTELSMEGCANCGASHV